MIYLDNAATTMHKPQTVIDAVTQAMCSLGNAGRGATSGALDAARTIHGCRAKLARLLGCPEGRTHVCFYAQLHGGAQHRHQWRGAAPATVWSQRCSSTTPCCVATDPWRQSRV